MKIFKTITIFSDGSCFFSQLGDTSLTSKLVIFQNQDDRNFNFNQKKGKITSDSKHSFYYKKKYLK